MIQEITKKIIDSIPISEKKRETIDIILDGGIFNGSYLAGSLFFVKEMEREGFYKVNRISSYSIGAIVAILFHIDRLDMVLDIYQYSIQHIGKKQNIDILNHLIEMISHCLPENIHETISNKVFISYYNVKKNKKIIKRKYKDKEDLLETVRKTCFFPLFLNGELFYKNRYVDGMSPYIFPRNKNRIIYIQLLSFDKIIDSFCINGEKTNMSRILYGLLDMHSLYLNKKTDFCKYMDNFTIKIWLFNIIKTFFEKILLLVLFISCKVGENYYKNLELYKTIKHFFSNLFKEYYSQAPFL